MQIAIIGSRNYGKLDLVRAFVASLDEDDWVVSGGATGVDSVAVDEARKQHLTHLVFPAQWNRHGRKAGFVRNALIVRHADKVVAFWDGRSKGTNHTLELAQLAGVPVEVVR